MPRKRVYHYIMSLRLKCAEELAVKAYAKRHELGVAEVIRLLVKRGLDDARKTEEE
jgi:hypothetical protein